MNVANVAEAHANETFDLPSRSILITWPLAILPARALAHGSISMVCIEAAVKILDALTHRKHGTRARLAKFLEFSKTKIDSPGGRCYSPKDR